MVFEAVVVELLNKFLRQYVENLDTSQLKIGIWGGDVILKDLQIRTTLFDDLDLPVRVKWGKLGKLSMKIPWKNLYGSQVVFNIEELLMVIIPNTEMKYDAFKEEKWAQEKKQTKLKAIEEARKRELETDITKQSDSFIEKLLTQITKNLQIEIKNIHIRYEDKTTIPGSPFSVGLTISNLSVQTTTNDQSIGFSNFMIANENLICKAVNLEGLSIYWNLLSALFSELPNAELEKVLIKSIPTANYKPKGFKYMFGPLSSSAFLRLNSKPELDGSNYTIPKIFVNIHLKEIELALTYNQFYDLLLFLENYGRLTASSKYKKYRPVGIPVIGYSAKWWRFAYDSVSESIKRRKREWNWENIRLHRVMCRKYLELFNQQLHLKKLSPSALEELNRLERKLNLFNLILLREQVYVELERTNLSKTEQKASTGWFSGWFGSSSSNKFELSEEDEFVKKIERVMTTPEKEKLYKAIGYEESAPPTNYPPTFVELRLWCHLEEIKLTIYDDRSFHTTPVMTSSIKTVKMEFERRPSAFASKLVMIIGNFNVLGKNDKDVHPELVTSNCTETQSLFEIVYETKPLKASCDQRIIVTARPLRIIYHAGTINLLLEMFSTGSQEDVNKIMAATSASLPTFQRITTMGLQYAMEKRTVLEVKINIMSSYLIIPFGGFYQPNKELLVVMLGHLSVETEENLQKDFNIKKLYLEGTAEQDIFSTVLSASYTKFKFHLSGVQILFQLSGEDWVQASKVPGNSPMRFLESINLEVILKKSLVTDDARIPKVIIEGKLPSLTFNFSEERFIAFAALFFSMPTKSQTLKKEKPSSIWSLQSLGAQFENKLVQFQKTSQLQKTAQYVQGIDLVGHFQMNEFAIKVSKTKKSSEKKKDSKSLYLEERFLNLRVLKMEIDLTYKTFETVNLLKLGALEINQHHNGKVLSFVSTKKLAQDYLFAVEYINLDRRVPDFYTTRSGILNRLTVNVTPLNVILNQEALLAQIAFATNVQMRLESVKQASHVDRTGDAGRLKENIEECQADKKVIARGKRFRKKRFNKEVIDFFLDASLDEIDILIGYEGYDLSEFCIKGGSVEISTRKSYTNLDFKLKEVTLLDLNPCTFYKEIVVSLDQQTLSSRVTVFNSDYFGSGRSVDMTIEAEFGQLRCSFVKVFFTRAFSFLNAFHWQIKSLKEGASVAAQRAKENVLKAYQNATKICLDIKMLAPLLIIPKTSVSLETIVVDLGVLTIKNVITELDYTLSGESVGRPIIDTVKLHLQNLKVSRCVMAEGTLAQEIENILLVPVSFELTVKRNLSKAWSRVIPELEILARLASIHVILTHEDLCFLVKIARDSLGEGFAGESPSPRHLKIKNLTHKKDLHYQFPLPQAETKDSQPASTFYATIKFMFFMDSFIFDALIEKVKDENEQVGLATFILETISLKGKMFSDNSIHTSIMLLSCNLDDTRPGKKEKIRRLMERTIDTENPDLESESNPLNSMIDVAYQRKDLDTFVDVRVYKFTLILSMDFLQKLGEFFTFDDCTKELNVESTESLRAVKPVEKAKKIIKEEEEEGERLPTLTINLRLEKPDIVIVENMDSIDTDALIFHTEMVVKFRFAGSRQVVSGTLSDIELYSCCFNPAKRSNTLLQVIKPFTISVAGSTPEDQGLHVDICLTEIAITISPSTVELLSKCYEALFKEMSLNCENLVDKEYSDLWEIKSFDPEDYWFLKPEPAIDALTAISSPTSLEMEKFSKEEICLLAIDSIVVSVEDSWSNLNKPLLLLEMSFELNCYNWTQQMSLNSTLSLQMKYYNRVLSAWEPIIEPVEEISEKQKHSHVPWELKCQVVFSDEGDLDWTNVQPPKISITLTCAEILQLTLTKTGLEVVKNVLETYSSAVTKGLVKKTVDVPPYLVKNETGLTVELLLKDCDLQVRKTINEDYKIVQLQSNSEVELQDKSIFIDGNMLRSSIKKNVRLYIRFPMAKKDVIELQLNMNSKRYYTISVGEAEKAQTWELVTDTCIKNNTTTITLQSIVKIVNDLYKPINLHLLSDDEKDVEYIGTVEGRSTFSLPFQAVYRTKKNLFFRVEGYSLSLQSFPWNNIKKEIDFSTLMQCNSKNPEFKDPFFIQAVGKAQQIFLGNTKRRTMNSFIYIIQLQPTVIMVNSLPLELIICFQGCAKERTLKPGDSLHITNAEPGVSTITLRISDYLEKEWSCKEIILENPPEFFIWKFVSYNGLSPEILNLGIHCSYNNKSTIYTIYCPYFMINKTEHLLSYKFDGQQTVFYHPSDMKLPVMFSTSAKKFFSKKSAFLQVEQSQWSEKFSVDVAGSGGTVICQDFDMIYKISVRITLTFNNLTRIVVFTPFYVFVNTCDYSIECKEWDFPDDPWLEIPEGSCMPFWPKSLDKKKKIHIRPTGSYIASPPFGYDSSDSCLLRLEHKYGGIFVEIQATQSGNYITFQPYKAGQAPVLIFNHSAKNIKLYELDTDFELILAPLQKVFHSWVCPTGERKLALMGNKQKKEVIILEQDVEDRVFTPKGEGVRYVTFLEGTQRMLLFTDDMGLGYGISNSIKGTFSGVEIVCKIQGIGLSLVNNINRLEILYVGFVSSGIAWEARKHGKTKFKMLHSEDSRKIESAYEKYGCDTVVSHSVDPVVDITEKLKVNFEKMEMIQPHKKDLRRTFEPGLWIAYRLLEDQVMLHMKVNRVQIDNQLHDCIFPVVLAPSPPPKTVATSGQSSKPFVELSLLKIQEGKKGVQQYKYFKILVQEFLVKIDIGLLQHVWLFLAAEESSDEQLKLKFKNDLLFTEQPLISHVEIVSSTEQKNFYDLLHFSPLKMRFSFSLAGNIDTGSLPPSFSVMLQSLGVTLTDAHDVVFRLSYYEKRSAFLTNSQVINEAISHYYGQAVRQAYVLLLGLDVIGNPYGLIVGIKEGVEAFFYEPVQGIIQGPSDFATGVAIGCRSLLGRTVGSTAGTLGKLTETLGKGLAVLSLDKEYQIQRMEAQHRNENIQASMARGGRGLVMGVFEGVTGVVKKPIAGAKEGGVGGFFKGMGKGMMGLVTRPVTGVVDFASSSFNAVKRVADPTVENYRLRPPRFLRDENLVEPYNFHDAKGNSIFYAICKRKYCLTDKYEFHAELKDNEVVILTNKRIILAELKEVFGTWQEHVVITWSSMPDRPHSHKKGVGLTMPPKGGGPQKDKPDIKVLIIEDVELKKEIYNRMVELYKLETENKS